MRQDLPFEYNFRGCRNFQVDRLAFDQRDRPPLQGTRHFHLVHIGRELNATDNRNHRLRSDRDGNRHGVIHGFIFLIHLADVLLQREQTTQRVSIMNHQAVHSPVHPRTIRVLGDHGVPRAYVPAAVAAVDQGTGKFEQIEVVAQENVFLARPALHGNRFDQLFFPLEIGHHDFLGRSAGTHTESQSRAREK